MGPWMSVDILLALKSYSVLDSDDELSSDCDEATSSVRDTSQFWAPQKSYECYKKSIIEQLKDENLS